MPLRPYMSPELIGLPWQYLVLGLALCLVLSALGFKRVVYFVSLGYAASIAAQAIVFPLLCRDTLRGSAWLQSGLPLAYGLRLGTFLESAVSSGFVPRTRVGSGIHSVV